MRSKITVLSLFALFITGCLTLQPRATVVGRTIHNAALGLSGFTYQVPAGMRIYNPKLDKSAQFGRLHELARRIYDIGEFYHPRDNEKFYESFLIMSDKTAFILVTVKYEISPSFDYLSSWTDTAPRWQILPLFNVSDSRKTTIGNSRFKAFVASGYAFEKKGWYYSRTKPGRTKFNFRVCKVKGPDRCSYFLMGFCLPENQDALSEQMPQMIRGFRF